MARRMPPVWFILKSGPSWPGIISDPPRIADGWAFLTDDNGIYLTDDDGNYLIVPETGA